MSKGLNDFDIDEVKNQARERLGMCCKTNDVIGTQIFSILGLFARVIYYPLGEEAPWGFTRISGTKNDVALEKPFVAINTSIPMDCQVFAAAHELYHIWYEKNPDILPSDLLDEEHKELNEKKANRFAAEFLMDEIMLRQEMEIYKVKEITIKNILLLSNLFVVPYRAMVKRLHEVGIIEKKQQEKLLSESDFSVQRYKMQYGFLSMESSQKIVMDNLAELAVKAFEAQLITYEKFEYLLDLCNLKSEDLGIKKESGSGFPSDEELDSIMEG